MWTTRINSFSPLTLSLMAVWLLMVCANVAVGQIPTGKSRITVASGVRVRSSPNTTADEVMRLGIGTVVDELEKSPSRERISGIEDYWYRIGVPGGKQGWVFGSFTASFDPANRAAAYRRIATERLKVEQSNFGDMADLARFLSSAATEITQPDATAELELARLMAIKRAAESLPVDKQDQPPYQAWIKANNAVIVYSEPGGQWLVKADAFWELAKQYRALTIGERIAWEAAQLPLPGECEGDPICALSYHNQTVGQYLNSYPRGVHAEEAMKTIIDALASDLESIKPNEPELAEYKADALKQVATMRATIQKTGSPSKARALELLASFEKNFRH